MAPRLLTVSLLALAILGTAPIHGAYTNFEAGQVNPIDLTPSGDRLLAVNTPDAMLEVFSVDGVGQLTHEKSIPVGLEPVTVVARTDSEAWVVNQLSDGVSVVDLNQGLTVRSLEVGDEPGDVEFANGRAFVSAAGDDQVQVFLLSDLDAPPVTVDLFSRKPRALAVSNDGTKVYAVPLLSGNQTTVVSSEVIWDNPNVNLDVSRLNALGLNTIACDSPPPGYPDMPAGITRDPGLPPPPNGVEPEVGLIVGWNEANNRWEDEDGQDWNDCLPFRMPDHDLFVIDTSPPFNVTTVDHLGTTLFEVSVNPDDDRIYVPNTDARNLVRFEHPQGVQGHIVENRLSIVDPLDSFSTTIVDLNTHINRSSDPATNLAEREASISQPGMMAWNQAGTLAYLTAIGSRKLFRVSGACTTGNCIFGGSRAAPDAVEVGEGPTGVALLELVSGDRAYVLNRLDNSIAIVDTGAMTVLDTVALHDPSPDTIKQGRRFLYDAIIGSGHGDAACSSCHISGDRDDLAWDLGAPTGEFVPYTTANDSVRFVVPIGGAPVECDPSVCAAFTGFDPQKGPMTTQTLRGMLEPLHWRGDRAKFTSFNPAFVGLMGTADISGGGTPAGLSDTDMEAYRQFALGITFPPNPRRNFDDTVPNVTAAVPGQPFTGNPLVGEQLFNDPTTQFDAAQPCTACHTHPFGAGGGKLGGVETQEPTSSDAAALFNGAADQNRHSDMKIAHLRNMYEKIGPVFGDHVGAPPLARSGVGFTHDGSIPDLGTFLSIAVFTMTAQQTRDVAAFMRYFPTGTKPAVGEVLTLAQGAPAEGSGAAPTIDDLIALGDQDDANRHCELVVATRMNGRQANYRFAGGSWLPDVTGSPALTTTQLRTDAEGPLTFLCAPLGSGIRLGVDRDEDGALNGDDCAAADPGAWGVPAEITGLDITAGVPTDLAWDALGAIGPSLRYEVASGTLTDLRSTGLLSATTCLEGDLSSPAYTDLRANPAVGDGYYYLVRGTNACGGDFGPGRSLLDDQTCP